MKQRVRIDTTLLAVFILVTGFLYLFPVLHPRSLVVDNVMDFLGLLVILKGNFLRMAARGHKKAHSGKGHGLVTTGPYGMVRNPMYLGTFFIGVGFILIVWPWWALPIFALLFYLRFRIQIGKEEEHLNTLFGQAYRDYCVKVPPFFPNIRRAMNMKFAQVFPYEELWTTQEKYGLVAWPGLVIILEVFQETIVFGFTTVSDIFLTIAGVMAVFFTGLFLRYKFL